MSFELPRLRKKLALILKDYHAFLKSPEVSVKGLLPELQILNPILAQKTPSVSNAAEAADFIDELKLFLAQNADNFSKDNEIKLSVGIGVLPGLGAKYTGALAEAGIESVKDALFKLPYRYETLKEYAVPVYDEGELKRHKWNEHKEEKPERGVLSGIFEESAVVGIKGGKRMFQAAFKKGLTYFYCNWLHFTNQYPKDALKKGDEYFFYGAVTEYRGVKTIFHPDFLTKEEINTVRPLYPIGGRAPQKTYKKAVNAAMDAYLPYINETIPEFLRYRYRFPDIYDSLNTLHNPVTAENADSIGQRAHPALLRMVYDEFFYHELRILMRKALYNLNKGISYNIDRALLEEITPLMPFRLTNSQRSALRGILDDMRSDRQMNRLLQGDVGSGKTIVAFICALLAVKLGFQSAILAPTEVLTGQHFRNLENFLRPTNYRIALLTASVKGKSREEIKSRLKSGDIDILVGTHAVIQEDVEFAKLGFAVIDEQHRFGVKQRQALMGKGFTPDILLMSATPIPRTLALTYYGDLDISEISEMPPGRIPPITQAFHAHKVNEAYSYVERHLGEGERAYFVYPAIEDSEASSLKSVMKSVEVIKKRFSKKNVGHLHGKMKTKEKQQMLDDFAAGRVDILVSTTVVEVGVDVKEATVILVENADRFGLAQLHQLRGRVGRNSKQAYCALVASSEISEDGFKRLRAMTEITSGFKLAELDLELRGQGDFFGVKQSGMPEFKYADIIRDTEILKRARRDAGEIIAEDAHIEKPAHKLLRDVLSVRYREEHELFNVG